MGHAVSLDQHRPPHPWAPFSRVLKMRAAELEAYYHLIRTEGLTQLQLRLLQDHLADLVRAASRQDTHLRWARTSPGYALARFMYSVVTLCVKSALTNPMAPMTDPVNWACSFFAYGAIFGMLTAVHIFFVVGHYLGLPRLIRYISYKYGQGQNIISWTYVGFYSDKADVVAAAISTLSGPPPTPRAAAASLHAELIGQNATDLAGREILEFNVDVAKALILMASIVYERDDEFVKLAAEYPENGMTYLLRSEELMYGCAKQWGMEFTSISDFELVSGPFIGAFYKVTDLGPGECPFIVLVVKGTSPDKLAEWITDASLNLEDASDWLGAGQAHEGFYTSLFPPPSSTMTIMPYTRILNTIKLIAARASEDLPPNAPRVRTNVFVAGHSLGSGIAALLYARLLEEPDDMGPHAALRDAYLFGAPRACAAALVSRVERNLRAPHNFGRAIWRVANRDHSRICGDIVTRIPPGLADDRHARGKVKPGSLLSYGAIGIRIDLKPNSHAPFYELFAVPVGQVARVVKAREDTAYGFEQYQHRSQDPWPASIIDWLVLGMTNALPFVCDHGPTEYYRSLCALQVEVKNRDGEHGIAQPAALLSVLPPSPLSSVRSSPEPGEVHKRTATASTSGAS